MATRHRSPYCQLYCILSVSVAPHLSHGVGQDVDDLLVGCGYHTLAVDLDDAMTHSDAAALSDAPTHETADLLKGQIESLSHDLGNSARTQKHSATHNAILDAEAQLVAEVWPSDEDSGHWGASNNVQLDPRLVL